MKTHTKAHVAARRWAHTPMSWVAALVGIVMIGATCCMACNAIGLQVNDAPGYWYKRDRIKEWNPIFDATGIGPSKSKTIAGEFVYCMETGALYNDIGTWTHQDSLQMLTAATMINRHQTEQDDLTQGAIAYAIHDHLDLDHDMWLKGRDIGFEDIDTPTLDRKAQTLWQDAYDHLPVAINVSNQYDSDHSSGTFNVSVLNPNNQPIEGIKLNLSLTGTAGQLESGKSEMSEITRAGSLSFPWKAVGEGSLNLHVSVPRARAERLESPEGQDVIRGSHMDTLSKDFSIDVTRQFQPTLAVRAQRRWLKVGQTVQAQVNAGFAQDSQWPDDISLHTQGYYFIGDAHTMSQAQLQQGESVEHYLNRLHGVKGLRYVAKAQTVFDKRKTSSLLTAQQVDDASKNNDSSAYHITQQDAGLLGSWVWVIARNEQADSIRRLLKSDVITTIGAENATNNITNVVSHDFSWNKQQVAFGKELHGTLKLQGLPKDYTTSFSDNAHLLTMKVWWAGSGSDQATVADNERYCPGKGNEHKRKEPQEDEHHHLVGTWKVPAVNGVYHIGEGGISVMSDSVLNSSKSQQTLLASHVHIRAQRNSESGWYIFMYELPDAQHVEGFTSVYADPTLRAQILAEETTHDQTNEQHKSGVNTVNTSNKKPDTTGMKASTAGHTTQQDHERVNTKPDAALHGHDENERTQQCSKKPLSCEQSNTTQEKLTTNQSQTNLEENLEKQHYRRDSNVNNAILTSRRLNHTQPITGKQETTWSSDLLDPLAKTGSNMIYVMLIDAAGVVFIAGLYVGRCGGNNKRFTRLTLMRPRSYHGMRARNANNSDHVYTRERLMRINTIV